MKSSIIKNSRATIMVASLLGLAYFLKSIYNSVSIAMLPNDKLVDLIPGLLFEFPIFIPVIIGFVLLKTNRETDFWTLIAFIVFGFVVIALFLLIIIVDDPLGFGLFYLIILLPILIATNLVLLVKFFIKK